MTVTPSGSPAWRRTNDHTSYGGNVNKANYQAIGAVNSLTDLTAENVCRLAADVAALARVAPFATMKITCNDGTPAAPTISNYSAMAGAAPTGARVGDGSITLTWASSYTDPYSVSADLHIVAAFVTSESASFEVGSVQLSDPDVNGLNERVAVAVFDSAAAAVADAVFHLAIYTGVS